ncbi:DUF1918 domain-containing protein [Nocardia mexicana]|uniref:Uncharacterized protein DUF1918 n=1 Tax=Nocardia mexicana TaxID=279262 RepID=A0A370H4N5_9NOCA|nr:DUF1918 domain-containing protein [Nocardia mexicana]RDI51143.1 uncharacterized protein DUF1918 [Nocardia mexicana]
MRAKPGDWLVVVGRAVGGAVRHGLIEEVRGADGGPPFLVHWSDNGPHALTFPGPDSTSSPPRNCTPRSSPPKRDSCRHTKVRHGEAERIPMDAMWLIPLIAVASCVIIVVGFITGFPKQ